MNAIPRIFVQFRVKENATRDEKVDEIEVPELKTTG